MEDTPEYRAQQDRVVREKVAYLKKKISHGDSAPIGPVSAKTKPSKDQKGEPEDRKLRAKAPNLPPPRKIAYTADDVVIGDMVVVYLPTKKGSYLAEVRKI
jgi:hypothetical protein